MMRLATIAIGCCVALSMPAAAQYEAPHATVVDIWPANAPGLTKRNDPEVAKDYWVRNVHNPSLTIFRPKHQNGAAVIVIPGGGHKLLVWTNEGVNVAQALSRYGLTVFVLKYRLAQDEGSTSTVEDAANDVRRSIRWVRARRNTWAPWRAPPKAPRRPGTRRRRGACSPISSRATRAFRRC